MHGKTYYILLIHLAQNQNFWHGDSWKHFGYGLANHNLQNLSLSSNPNYIGLIIIPTQRATVKMDFFLFCDDFDEQFPACRWLILQDVIPRHSVVLIDNIKTQSPTLGDKSLPLNMFKRKQVQTLYRFGQCQWRISCTHRHCYVLYDFGAVYDCLDLMVLLLARLLIMLVYLGMLNAVKFVVCYTSLY